MRCLKKNVTKIAREVAERVAHCAILALQVAALRC